MRHRPFRLLLLVLFLTWQSVGCMTSPALRPAASSPEAQPPLDDVDSSGAQKAVEDARTEQVMDEVSSLLLLARQQARLGLLDSADATWQQAVDRLRPLAIEDEVLTGYLRSIEAERERAREFALSRGEALSPLEDQEPVREVLLDPVPDSDPEHTKEVQEATRDVTPDYPVDVNDRVVGYLDLYSKGRLRDWFASSLERSGTWLGRLREIFKEEGLPEDLVYLAHVESAFKTSAYSRARARGIFQFISATGRRYGLEINWWVDERADPEKSARASASYLRDLYEEFGDWKLALAAYNAGEGRVRRSIKVGKTRDYWELISRRFFRRETRNYVPAIFAATLIAKDPASFGFENVKYLEPADFEFVEVPTETDLEILARCARTDVETLRRLNPALRRSQTPPNYPNYPLRVPKGHAEGFHVALAKIPVDERIVLRQHVVRRGDTLSTIARNQGTTVRAIQEANGMGRRTLLRVGQVLAVPRGPGAPVAYEAAVRTSGSGGTYRVRRGDSLGRIARRFGVSVRQLQQWNELGRSTRIYAGQRLHVGSTASRSTFSRASNTRSTRSVAKGGVHIVRSGDTLWDISRRYGVSVRSLQQANGLRSRSILKLGQRLTIPGAKNTATRNTTNSASAAGSTKKPVAVVAGGMTHRVRSGETLWDISRKYGVELSALLSVNGLGRRSVIHPGQAVTIPGEIRRTATGQSNDSTDRPSSTVHIVRRGENLWTISRRYGLSVQSLLRHNELSKNSVIHPGDRIAIP